LRRGADGKQTAIPFRFGAVQNGEALETNILLNSGDIVVVP
jgi:polysaccharide export outer membrane protein